MQFICCPECFSSDFTEDYVCRECQESLLTGKKISDAQKKKNLLLSGQVVYTSTKKPTGRSFKQKFLISASCFVVLLGLVGFAYQQSYFGKVKSLKTVVSQLSAQNDLNKFAVETNDKKTLTAITLTQESVKVAADTNSFSNIKLLFDCVIDRDFLTRTPDEYHITILSNNLEFKNSESAQLQFQTGKKSLTIEKQIDDNSPEYVSYLIPRKELENIAASNQIDFQIGKYRGQMNFAQQQSLKSFLIATSIDSKID